MNNTVFGQSMRYVDDKSESKAGDITWCDKTEALVVYNGEEWMELVTDFELTTYERNRIKIKKILDRKENEQKNRHSRKSSK